MSDPTPAVWSRWMRFGQAAHTVVFAVLAYFALTRVATVFLTVIGGGACGPGVWPCELLSHWPTTFAATLGCLLVVVAAIVLHVESPKYARTSGGERTSLTLAAVGLMLVIAVFGWT